MALPVVLRAFITPTTLILAAGSGLTVLNLGLTIATGKGYQWKNPVGLSALVALIGFILAGLQALILPLNPLNVIVHNTYYVVGHFHLMIWTIIVVGYVSILLDMLTTKMNGATLTNLSSGMISGGIIMWTIGAFLLGYTMSYAGYEGLIRRWVAYPVRFLPYMDAMTFFAIIMGASFVMYGLPVLFTLLGVKTSLFWETSGLSGVSNMTISGGSGTSPTMSTKEIDATVTKVDKSSKSQLDKDVKT